MIAGIPDGWVALGAGTALVLGGLSLVLWPLVNADASQPAGVRRDVRNESRRKSARPTEASDGAVAALREIEFDRATGKLSDVDYADLKSRYTLAALAELRAADAQAAAHASALAASGLAVQSMGSGDGNRSTDTSLNAVDAAIANALAHQKSCAYCGPRAEPDALYCSHCGTYLPGACAECGATVPMSASHFCIACGDQLAA